jgi:hypothetical protein
VYWYYGDKLGVRYMFDGEFERQRILLGCGCKGLGFVLSNATTDVRHGALRLLRR